MNLLDRYKFRGPVQLDIYRGRKNQVQEGKNEKTVQHRGS